MALFKEVADIQTSDTLNLPIPEAKFETIVVKPSSIQEEMVEKLGERAEDIKRGDVNPKDDNMLKITNEGRKLALDQRLINDMLPDFENSKVNACAENIYKIWKETAEKKSTQLVFCDLSTPKNTGTMDNPYEMELVDGKWKLKEWKFTDVYTDLKRKLIEKGIPENEIAFIHDANNDTQKPSDSNISNGDNKNNYTSDPTIAKENFPKAGKIVLTFVLVSLIGCAGVGITKMINLRDVK